MRGLMIQGTSSSSGKSFIVTGLCRLLANMGVKVCPFKSQNMSNNSHLTPDGLEISTAQAVQAEAAKLTPSVYMNPILLKPRHNCSSEIILNGRVFAHDTKNYRHFTQHEGIAAVREALAHIGANFEAVIIEGAGSPAEVNLNATEIVNMRIAREADVNVVLVADVDRGGSLAAVVGTLELLGLDRERVKGIIFNKFRGDIELFRDAVTWTENYTGVKVLGVLPYLEGVNLPSEDSLNIHEHTSGQADALNIGVLKFPYISNFPDIEPLEREEDVNITYVDGNTGIKALHDLDALILPGTKNTFAAVDWLRDSGLEVIVRNFRGYVFGICGGLQVMGSELLDPLHVENNSEAHAECLGILPLSTRFEAEKITRKVEGWSVTGYEIHNGRTAFNYSDEFRPLFTVNGKPEGMRTADFRKACTYLHGVFANDWFRNEWLNVLRKAKKYAPHQLRERGADIFDVIASHLRLHTDVNELLKLSRII